MALEDSLIFQMQNRTQWQGLLLLMIKKDSARVKNKNLLSSLKNAWASQGRWVVLPHIPNHLPSADNVQDEILKL